MSDLPTIDVVAHAYRYEKCLAFHLSALLLYPPARCRLRAVIYYAADDFPVAQTLDFFETCRDLRSISLESKSTPPIEFDFRPLPQPQLLRRAIGRDQAARTTNADYILFADVDYLFGPGALDAIAEQLAVANKDGPVICYPRYVLQSIDHERGDAELARVDKPQLIEIEPSRYEAARLPRVIGGCQYISGGLARRKGYLPEGHRFLKPAVNWARTFEDKLAVNWWDSPIVPIEVPNVIRIRHSRRGRFDIDCRN